jgi:hypothetical protein
MNNLQSDNKLHDKIVKLHNQSIENYKKIQKLQRIISILNSNKQLYIGEQGGLYYISKKRKIYV